MVRAGWEAASRTASVDRFKVGPSGFTLGDVEAESGAHARDKGDMEGGAECDRGGAS